jgi:hypothetical protein
VRTLALNVEDAGGRAPPLVFGVGAPTRLRVDALRAKLSTDWLKPTRSDAYRASVFVGLARLGDATAKPWPVGDLRRLARESPGESAKNVTFVVDEPVVRQVEAFRKRLSTRSRRISKAAALRTLVLVGLDYAEPLPLKELGKTLALFSEKVNAAAPGPGRLRVGS